MKRRELIKGIAAMGALALLPGIRVPAYSQNHPLHFIGLGSAGRNALMHIYKKGIHAKYAYLCDREYPEKHSEVEYLFYEYPRYIRQPGALGKQPVPLTREMKKIFADDHLYIVIVGLGAYTGSSLITSVLDFLESNHKRYLAICTLPFKNEGKTRNLYALEKREELGKYQNVYFFDNKRIYELYHEERIVKTFELSNEEIYCIFKQELRQLRT